MPAPPESRPDAMPHKVTFVTPVSHLQALDSGTDIRDEAVELITFAVDAN